MATYATPADLAAYVARHGGGTWAPPPEPRVLGLLEEASGVVDAWLIGAVYATDADGLPTDTTVAAGLRDAVCAHVLAVGEGGGYTGADAGDYTSIKIGTVSLTRDAGAAPTAQVDRGLLHPSAARLLARSAFCRAVVSW